MSTFFLRSITRIHDCAKSKIVRIVTAQCHLMVALVRQLRGECYFLVSEQESKQRSRLGGDADREAYRYFRGLVTSLPRLQAALPQGPLSAPVVTWSVVGF